MTRKKSWKEIDQLKTKGRTDSQSFNRNAPKLKNDYTSKKYKKLLDNMFSASPAKKKLEKKMLLLNTEKELIALWETFPEEYPSEEIFSHLLQVIQKDEEVLLGIIDQIKSRHTEEPLKKANSIKLRCQNLKLLADDDDLVDALSDLIPLL